MEANFFPHSRNSESYVATIIARFENHGNATETSIPLAVTHNGKSSR